MSYYSDDMIEEVRQRNDIVDVISQYVRLTKKGSNYFGLCPFHNEKSPSFSVTPAKQMYYCFGCGAGGNVFTFLMEYENFTFGEAMEALAERAGVELPRQEYSSEQRREADKRARLLKINREAATYFYALLRNERGKRALAYFQKRDLSDETIKKFGLGYSDQYSDDLYRYLRAKGYEDEILKESGLVTIDERRGGHDKFWNRAMFPIMDIHNKVIGFGGRVMGEGEPKYLNSPETKIFDKSRNLYGLNLARSTKRPQILLCEGYMDVIALHQAGFDNAAASLGTSLTEGHAALLKRCTKEVYLTYDSDGAGVRAALRAIPMLKDAGLTVKVVDLRPCKDPDEFIKTLGAGAYQERIDAAENSFLYEIRMLERQYDMQDPDGKTAFYQETAKKLCGFTEKLERENYIEAVAARYLLAVDDLRRLVNQYGARMGLAGGTASPGGAPSAKGAVRRNADGGSGEESIRDLRQAGKRKKKEDGMKQSQKLLLTWLIEDPGLFGTVGKFITPEDFTEEMYRKAAGALFAQYEETGEVNPAKIVSMFEGGEEQREIAGLFNATIRGASTKEDRGKALKETIVRVKENSISHRSRELSPTDLAGLMKLVEDRRTLEALSRRDC